MLPLFNVPEVLSCASDKVKFFPINFNLDDSGFFFLFFPSRTNLKVCNILVTPKLVEKVITNLDL